MNSKSRGFLFLGCILALVVASHLTEDFGNIVGSKQADNAEFEVEKIDIQVASPPAGDIVSDSFLKDAHSSGEIHVCLVARVPKAMTAHVPSLLVEERKKDLERLSRKSINRWFSFLRYHKTWTRREVTFKYHHSQSDCESWKGRKITIVSDVGPVRTDRRGDICARRLVGGIEGRYFAAPDDRICVASYEGQTHTALVSAGGSQGEFPILSHLIGHAFGLGDAHDAVLLQSIPAVETDNSIMSATPLKFGTSDVVAIQSVWTRLTAGLPCVQINNKIFLSEAFHTDLRCVATRVENATVRPDGSQVCPKGRKFWLSPLQVCVQVDASVDIECPQEQPVYDPNAAVCCPIGKSFDPSQLSCSSSDLYRRRTEYLLHTAF